MELNYLVEEPLAHIITTKEKKRGRPEKIVSSETDENESHDDNEDEKFDNKREDCLIRGGGDMC